MHMFVQSSSLDFYNAVVFSSQAPTSSLVIEFNVTATDNGFPQAMNSSVRVTLSVFSPDNHFSPMLDQTTYKGSVDENTASEAIVLNFTVLDADPVQRASEIGNLVLFGDDSTYFSAQKTGPHTGVLLTKWVQLYLSTLLSPLSSLLLSLLFSLFVFAVLSSIMKRGVFMTISISLCLIMAQYH